MTKVGYAGGTKENPTYREMGDHTETIQIIYDPRVITYADLVESFFLFHTPTRKLNTQYRSVIFYHDNEQKDIAIGIRDKLELSRNVEFVTDFEPYTEFYLAEFYHQKYYLQNDDSAMELLKAKYSSPEEFLNSPKITKLNGAIALDPVGFAKILENGD